MRMFAVAAALAGVVTASTALAQSPTNDQTQACRAQARQQTLSGDALATFIANCAAERPASNRVSADTSQNCATKAKMLSGEDKVQAMRACAAQ